MLKKNTKPLVFIIFLVTIFILFELYFHFGRFFMCKIYFDKCVKLAKEKNKKLMVIGDPCVGSGLICSRNIFYSHGDVTIDLFGCNQCDKMDINNISSWKKYNSNEYVVFETATLSFSKDINSVLEEIKRVSGGDFYSTGGTRSLTWILFGHKLYSKNYPENIKICSYPYTPNKKYFMIYDIYQHKFRYIPFK